MKPLIFAFLCLAVAHSQAQDLPIQGQKRIFFPYPMEKGWQFSIGTISTTMPQEITEEVRYRVPAGDLHLLRKLAGKFYLDGRVNFQILQNIYMLGLHWATPLSHRTSLGLGDDVGYWAGRIDVGGIRTRGHGYTNTPNASFGYRFNKRILLTLRGEALMNFGIQTYAAATPVKSDYRIYSGTAYSVVLEQPFAGSKSMTLGFRVMYTDYYWQTWTLFENYDRKLYFPQIIVGLIL